MKFCYGLKKNNIEFISSVPSTDFDYDYKDIFTSKSQGTYLTRIFNQFLMIFNSLGSDGGLFVLIGKKIILIISKINIST